MRYLLKYLAIYVIFFIAISAVEAAEPSAQIAEQGNLLSRLRKFDTAVKKYDEALAISSDPELEGKIHYNKGVALYNRGEFQAAAISFTRALATPSDILEAKASYNIGNCKFKLSESFVDTSIDYAIALCKDALRYYKWAIDSDVKIKNAIYNYEFVKKKLDYYLVKKELMKEQKNQQRRRQKQDKEQQEKVNRERQQQQDQLNKQQQSQQDQLSNQQKSQQDQLKDQQRSQQDQLNKQHQDNQKQLQDEYNKQKESIEKSQDSPEQKQQKLDDLNKDHSKKQDQLNKEQSNKQQDLNDQQKSQQENLNQQHKDQLNKQQQSQQDQLNNQQRQQQDQPSSKKDLDSTRPMDYTNDRLPKETSPTDLSKEEAEKLLDAYGKEGKGLPKGPTKPPAASDDNYRDW